MDEEDVEMYEKIVKILLDVGYRKASVDLDTELRVLGIDSLNLIELILRLEDEFSFVTTEGSLERTKFHTVGDVKKFVEEQVKGDENALGGNEKQVM